MKENVNKDTSKVKKVLETIFIIFATIFSITSIAVSSTIIFHNNYYELFWVNGQSMYPTLNGNAKYANGELIGKRDIYGPIGNYDVDYGYMDAHDSVIDNLKRFDIIVCKQNAGSNLDIIKRVLALPGETFYFITSDYTNEKGDTYKNGDLFVKEKGAEEFQYVPQTFISEELLRAGKYNDEAGNTLYYEIGVGYPLDENEYFVVGDNRNPSCSSDSRQQKHGIYRENIKAKAIGLEGVCTVVEGSDGKATSGSVKHFWPTRF